MGHLRENGENYLSHAFFACKISIYLSIVSVFFMIHGLLPFIKIPSAFNIDQLNKSCLEWKNYADNRVRKRDEK